MNEEHGKNVKIDFEASGSPSTREFVVVTVRDRERERDSIRFTALVTAPFMGRTYTRRSALHVDPYDLSRTHRPCLLFQTHGIKGL